MIGSTHCLYTIADESHTGALRRAVKEIAVANGLDDEIIGRAEIVASEMATNLLKHSNSGGDVLVAAVTAGCDRGLEILCLDKGPGMSDPEAMIVDGISTSGTLGGGLGAIKRLSDVFDLISKKGEGTGILSRLYAGHKGSSKKQDKNGGNLEVGGVIVPIRGETVSGDQWALRADPGIITALVVDGLGHGKRAAQAAQEAVKIFLESQALPPSQLLNYIHQALKSTQGAAAAIARIDAANQSLVYAGVGNIAGRIFVGEESRGCVSLPGGLGFQLPELREFSYPWTDLSTLVMNSDGLTSTISLSSPGGHHPSLLAALLYRDFHRQYDDASALIITYKESKGQ